MVGYQRGVPRHLGDHLLVWLVDRAFFTAQHESPNSRPRSGVQASRRGAQRVEDGVDERRKAL